MEQTPEVALTIRRIVTLVPAITTVVAILALMFIFTLTKEKVVDLNIELEEIRE